MKRGKGLFCLLMVLTMMFTAVLPFEAVLAATDITVNYELYGGEITGLDETYTYYEYGDDGYEGAEPFGTFLNSQPEPELEGYGFMGWYYLSGYNTNEGPVYEYYAKAEDGAPLQLFDEEGNTVDVFAGYAPAATFYASGVASNGETVANTFADGEAKAVVLTEYYAPIGGTYEENVEFSEEPKAIDNYEFAYYYEGSNSAAPAGEDNKYPVSGTKKDTTENYPDWYMPDGNAAKVYRAYYTALYNFDANGGTWAGDVTTRKDTPENIEADIEAGKLVNGEREFLGWFEDTVLTAGVLYENMKTKAAGTTFYAKWTKTDPAYTLPTGLSATYGDTLADVDVSSYATAEGSFSWVDTATDVGAVGDREHLIRYTPSDDVNYNVVETKVVVNVGAKTINNAIALNAPVANAEPQTTIEASEYTATVEWSPAAADKFEYSTVYTATITITPKDNYTTVGIPENGYTVTGAKTTANAENSNIVTAEFAQTDKKPSNDNNSGGGGGIALYTVKFESNGGSEVEDKKVIRNFPLEKPAEPIKDGYSFIGWYTDAELTTAYDFDAQVKNDFTLYAKWAKHDDETVTPDVPKEWENPFTDVKESDWYYEDVKYTVENGLFNGITGNRFAPNMDITRAMFVTVLYRLEGEPSVGDGALDVPPFADVDMSSYYADAVIWAKQNGIVKGVSETEFAPDENIIREQIAAIMYRYAQYKNVAPTGAWAIRLDYADLAEISDYAVEGVMYCKLKEIMQGKENNNFAPRDNATRAEIAAILHRFIESNK